MNIFTKDDYRKIQAWLKANSIKDSDLASVNDTIPEEDTLVLVQKINGILSNVKISIKNLLNSTLSKVIINTIIANAVKVNNTLTVTASNVKIDNEKGTTLQDVLDYFEGNKLNRHTDDTFDGNLTVKKNITIEGNIKSHDDTITVEADLEATGEITDGQGNMLSDVNDASKGWKIEYQDPQQDEPTVRAKYVLKDYRGVPKGNVIKIYKDSAITNVYLGTVEDTCNPDTGEVTKHPIHDNNEALSIVYRLDTGKYSLVNVPIKIFTTEAEFDKYRGLGVTSNGQVFIKLASDIESSNYLHFNELGEITADGIETRILRDLGDIITSVAGDDTMWGVYKEHEGTQETSTPNDGSRWGEFKRAEEIREQIADSTHQVFADNWDTQDDNPELPQDKDVVDEASYAYNWKSTDSTKQGNLGDLAEEVNELSTEVSKLENEVIYDVTANNNGAIFASLSELLLSEHISTLIPASVRHGGMTIRFIKGSEQSSGNKYVQYRLMATSFSTTISDWQDIDDKPTVGSNNLVKSGGVAANNNSTKISINNVNFTFDAIQLGEVILLDSLTLNENQRVRIDVVNSLNYTEADAIRIYDNIGNIVNTINTIRVDNANRYVNYTPSSNINGYSISYLHKGNASSTVGCTIQVQNAITGEKDDINTQIFNNSTKILKVKSIRYLRSGYAVGDYYIPDIDGSPRLVKSVNSSGAITSYIEYEKSKNILIEYNNRIYSYNTDGNLQEIVGNFVEIYGLYAIPTNPQIGTYYVSSSNNLRLIKSLNNGRPSSWFTIPFDSSTIYKYYNDFYFWNGASLVKFGTANVINLVSLFESPTILNINDYFVNEKGALKKVSTEENSILNVTPSKNDIYLYEGKIYKYITIGKSHLTGNDINWFVSNNDIIKLSGYGGVPSQPKVGDYYYNGTYLRIITRLNKEQTTIYDYVNVEFSNKSLYLYNGVYYKYNGSKLVLLEAPQEKNLQVSSIPYYVDNANKKMVLCGVLYDNSKTPQNRYSIVSHPEPIGWLYYDKEAQDALYFAKFTAERIEKLLDWNDMITTLQPSRYSFAICPNMDIICVPRGERLLNRDNSPIIYQHQDYTQPVLLNVQKQNSAGVLVKPTGWFGSAGVNVDYADGTIIFGEYTREQTEPANIWKVSAPYNNADNWEIVYSSQGTGEEMREVEHFHAINFDIFTGRLYAVSGDSVEESKIYESTDGGATWAVVYGGVDSNTRIRARSLNWVFTKEGAFYGSDQGPLLVKIGRGDNDVLDFTTIQIVVDKQNKQNLVENGETRYEVYYTCLCDSPYGILLLGYQQLGNANPLPIYFYDIKNNTFVRTFLLYPLPNSGGTGYNPNGFRCDAVSVYQSVFEKRFVCGFNNINAYIGISGNNGSELSNVTLNLI